ncbi:MAG: protein kinase domain-containing protein [Acidimicrobiales bacterium]
MIRLPEQGDILSMSRVGSALTVGRRLQQGGQGVVHESFVGDGVFAMKWLRVSDRTAALRASIEALVDRPRPNPAFVWPIDIVTSAELEGFGYVMRLLEPRYVSFARMLQDQPTFRSLTTVARKLVDSFAALHSSGLCYRDISFNNLYVDPIRSEVAVIDNDNVGLDGGDVFVKGTNQFMAPEVVRDEALPSTVTDLWSLAVFLFILFVRGHPLEGLRAVSSYSWAQTDHASEHELLLRNFGFGPVFVFDPDDDSNRPSPESPMLIYWPIYPQFFRDLMTRSFTVGLTDASLSGRPTGSVWRRALLRLSDMHATCRCNAAIFFDPDEPGRPCWRCGNVPPPQPILRLPGRSLVLSEGSTVSSDHLRRDRAYDQAVAVVEAHPSEPGAVVLRNLGPSTWSARPVAESERAVAPSQRLGVRPMGIDFGSVAGEIALSELA